MNLIKTLSIAITLLWGASQAGQATQSNETMTQKDNLIFVRDGHGGHGHVHHHWHGHPHWHGHWHGHPHWHGHRGHWHGGIYYYVTPLYPSCVLTPYGYRCL